MVRPLPDSSPDVMELLKTCDTLTSTSQCNNCSDVTPKHDHTEDPAFPADTPAMIRDVLSDTEWESSRQPESEFQKILEALPADFLEQLMLPPPPPSLDDRLEKALGSLQHLLMKTATLCAKTSSLPDCLQRGPNFPAVTKWKNIDISLPVVIPVGTLIASKSDTAADCRVTYEFSPNLPARSVAVLGSEAIRELLQGETAESLSHLLVPASMLRARMAVIHKCPQFLLPIIAQIFKACLESRLPLMSKPINLSCSRITRCSIVQRNSGRHQERVEALVDPATEADEVALWSVSTQLGVFGDFVNETVRQLVADWYTCAPLTPALRCSLPNELFHNQTRSLGLEFRWSPSRQMKILLAQRPAPELTKLITMKVDCKGLQMSELRMEQERKTELQWDPLILEKRRAKVPCREIVRTDHEDEARILLVEKSAVDVPNVVINEA